MVSTDLMSQHQQLVHHMQMLSFYQSQIYQVQQQTKLLDKDRIQQVGVVLESCTKNIFFKYMYFHHRKQKLLIVSAKCQQVAKSIK